jgi:hypothetical protein
VQVKNKGFSFTTGDVHKDFQDVEISITKIERFYTPKPRQIKSRRKS